MSALPMLSPSQAQTAFPDRCADRCRAGSRAARFRCAGD